MWTLSPLEIEALVLSLEVSSWAVACSLPVGIIVAWILARREFPGKTLLNGLVHLPLILPPVVVGYVLLILLGRRGLIGAWLHDVFGRSESADGVESARIPSPRGWSCPLLLSDASPSDGVAAIGVDFLLFGFASSW